MDKDQLAQFTDEHKEHLEKIVSFMVHHNISGFSLHEPDNDNADVTMDLVFTE